MREISNIAINNLFNNKIFILIFIIGVIVGIILLAKYIYNLLTIK